MDSDDILHLVTQREDERLEWKDSRILNDSFKLARSMAAMANNDGGLILVGVKIDGTLEHMKSKKGHEEHIINIASDKCNPPIRIRFQNVKVTEESTVYVLTIPQRKQNYNVSLKYWIPSLRKRCFCSMRRVVYEKVKFWS